MIRVIVADDQELVRTGFRMILDAQPDIEVVQECADGREAVEAVASRRPDVVLMDIRMPGMDGLEATALITRAQPEARVLMLTTFDADEYVFRALQAGASGFVLKDIRPDDLTEAVRVVARGDALLSPQITRRLVERFSRQLAVSAAQPKQVQELTEREREVLAHVARARTNAEIAEAMFVSPTTVKTHVSSVLSKLGLRDRVQAVVFAYEHGIVTPGE